MRISWRQTRRQGCVDQGRPPSGFCRTNTAFVHELNYSSPFSCESRLGSHGGRRGPVRLEGTLDPSHAQSSFYTSPVPSDTCDGKGLTHLPSRVCIIGKGQLRPRICMASIFRYWDTKA